MGLAAVTCVPLLATYDIERGRSLTVAPSRPTCRATEPTGSRTTGDITRAFSDATVELAGTGEPVDLVVWSENSTAVDPFTDVGARSEITRASDAICFDVSYDDAIHGQVADGAQLITVQTSNAMFINTAQIDQQFEISRLRAIETGRYVVVAAINGVSGIIGPDREVVESADPRTRAVIVGDVSLADELTPAVAMGPWPGRIIVVIAFVSMAFVLVTYRRRTGQDSARPARREQHAVKT